MFYYCFFDEAVWSGLGDATYRYELPAVYYLDEHFFAVAVVSTYSRCGVFCFELFMFSC